MRKSAKWLRKLQPWKKLKKKGLGNVFNFENSSPTSSTKVDSRRLVERLEGLRQSRLGNGETDCILCGEVFRFYHHSQKRCAECAKMTCGKCGKEYAFQGATGPGQPNRPTSSLASSASMSGSMTSLISSALFGGPNSSAGNQDQDLIWLCKICAEQREMWKKSGAWFFKVMQCV